MSRPLVVTDCDEVLLHMVRYFRTWLGESHEIDLVDHNFSQARFRDAPSDPVPQDKLWKLLWEFFDSEMHRQTPIAGSVESIAELQREADVVVLTNLTDDLRDRRAAQLRKFGIEAKVFTNQGPKGHALKRIVEEFAPSRFAFIDDIASHHASAADTLPHSKRLQLCGEPSIAPHVPCAHKAGHAHARIDNWAEALPWLLETLHKDQS